MEELIYTDLGGQYFLLDYSPSHSEMVIRRRNTEAHADIFNIDLFFKAVHRLQLGTKLNGINIYKVKNEYMEGLFGNLSERKEIYKVVDGEQNVGFIDASVFTVFHNKLDILATSLGDFTWSEENKEVMSAIAK